MTVSGASSGCRESSDGRIAVLGSYRAQGRRTGRPLEARFVHVLSFAYDGRIDGFEQIADSARWWDAIY
jgi:2-(1,2-epoxy-1,2-dihydrophenyl)acetyl-CoA isomerase